MNKTLRRRIFCSLVIYSILASVFVTKSVEAIPYKRGTDALTVNAPPWHPTGNQTYEGILVQKGTTYKYNVTIYVDFNNNTVFVDLFNETTKILDKQVLTVKLAMNKTLPWGHHLFFKAVSSDKNTKLMVNKLKWFTLCHIVTSGTAYTGFVSEKNSH